MSHVPKRLAILTHSSDRFRLDGGLLLLLIPKWQAMGIRVDIVTERGPFVEADVALLHVDQSVVPDACRRVADRYPRVVNGRVLDIRKRTFSTLLLEHDMPARNADEGAPVIVKSDWNYGGLPECRWRARQSPFWSLVGYFKGDNRVLQYLLRRDERRSWRRKRVLRDYRVYPHSGLVPEGVWRNRNLIVERFMAERDGDLYCCRHWLFFGTREVSVRTFSREPMVKFITGAPAVRSAEPLLEPIPDELRAMRARLGFDYGKFDYAIVNGQVVLYDVNRTPGASSDPRNHQRTLAVLPEGLYDFLS